MAATNALQKNWCPLVFFVVSTSKMKIRISIAALLLSAVGGYAAPKTTPQYQIYDIGVVEVGDTASQGFGVSHAGIAVGRSIRSSGSQAFTWTLNGGIVGLPNLSGRNHAVANSAAPPTPWSARATSSVAMFGATPHRNDATVKIETPTAKSNRRP